MTYCRFEVHGQAHYGLVEAIAGVDSITRLLLVPRDADHWELEGFSSKRYCHVVLAEAVLLAPVQPSNLVCIGRNFLEHAAELGHHVTSVPVVFLKHSPSTIAD